MQADQPRVWLYVALQAPQGEIRILPMLGPQNTRKLRNGSLAARLRSSTNIDFDAAVITEAQQCFPPS
jgi:hypothetical protein